ASFSYTVTDPNGHVSFAATVTITVTRPGIHGTVIADAGGAGVAGITVRLYQDGVGFTSKSATTNAAGFYDIGPSIPAGTYRVIFRDTAQSYVDEWADDSVLRATSTPVTFTPGDVVTLNAGLATGAEIDVTISNLGTFTVALYDSDPTGASAYRSVSGVSSATALRGLPAGSYYVSVTDPTKALDQKWSGNQSDRAAATPITVASGESAGSAFTLVAPNTIGGTVSDSEGPVAAVAVQAYNATTGVFTKSAKTDEAGTYAIKGLPAGPYKLVFRDSSGDHPVTWFGGGEVIGSATPVTMTNGAVLTVDGEIPVAATISGTITGGPSGTTPLVGAKVTPYRNGVAVKTFVTDATGGYTATGLAPGDYTVLFMATGHKTEYNLDRPRKADADIITITEGDGLTLDATLAPA
ncbi:MAG TPA: carboxypeptidase-like regulatory domain-containing protein, partial [Acidimicrobiales bacterium]|nr:carboxypeptidase-like regulatory domain-containing protein [Acidimicrobiales bacterium]